MEYAATVMAVVMTIFWMTYRQREAARPLSPRKILIPPIGMSTGAFMYVVPAFRPAPTYVLEAVGAGVVCGAILVATTKLELRDQAVYLRRSRAFMYILLGLIAVRWVARIWLRQSIPFQQLSGMFFLLALVMILEWRAAMFLSYRRLAAELTPPSPRPAP
jgi:membrane protein CcdC involved in cytochrome C biogenesis